MRFRDLPIALAIAFACHDNDEILPPLPKETNCTANIELDAWTAANARSDGAIDVSGSTRAPDGVTVRAVYVASTHVTRSDFNYRAWNVRVPADQVAATVRDGKAYLPVTAYSSVGCAKLPHPLVVRVEEGAGGAPSGGQGGEGGS